METDRDGQEIMSRPRWNGGLPKVVVQKDLAGALRLGLLGLRIRTPYAVQTALKMNVYSRLTTSAPGRPRQGKAVLMSYITWLSCVHLATPLRVTTRH